MANHSPFLKATRISAAVALCIASCASAWAQQNPTEITITDKLAARVSGFGDAPAQELPFSTTTIDSATLKDIGAQRVSDALRLDASVSDSYNSPAYWDMLSVRGYTLDNRYNYRREGLPINAETMIPMDNKERIELLKGTSGIQAGTSSPGGLVNYVVKRAPLSADQPIRNLTFSVGQGNNQLAAADLGGRFGLTSEFGYRINLAHEDLDPYIRDTKGHRDLVALAMDWRLKPGTVIDVELEHSHREQIGVNAYSLLGGVLPSPVDPRINLTRRPWSQSGVFDALTGSIRLRQELDKGWRWTTQYGAQRMKTDDRLTFGFGCDDPIDYTQYCPKNTGTTAERLALSDFRSENERRLTDVIQTEIDGQIVVNDLKHSVSFGIMRQRQLDRLPAMQAWNAAGWTDFNNGGISSPNATLNTVNANRSEYATELSFKDRVELTQASSVWLGLRHVMFDRSSERNDPADSNFNRYKGHMNVPWVGGSTKFDSVMLYASHGHGIENFVVPNSYGAYWVNAGSQLGVGRSRQTEIGLRDANQQGPIHWNAALFKIERPLAYDDGNGRKLLDGIETHEGLELGANYKSGQWKLGSTTQWLTPSISNVAQTQGVVGTTPINVPKFVLRGVAEYRHTSVPGLRTGLRVSHEGERNVTETGSIQLPAWTTFDASAHYDTKVNNVASTWSLAIDNLEDKRYWRESPKQFGHYYLYPGAPRTFRATVQFRM